MIFRMLENRGSALIDVGGGQSFLVGRLLYLFSKATVLDTCQTAIQATTARQDRAGSEQPINLFANHAMGISQQLSKNEDRKHLIKLKGLFQITPFL